MIYTMTLHDGQLAIPSKLLNEAGLAADATVNLRAGNGALVIEPVEPQITIAEAETRFPGEWVFLAVTQTDEHGMALSGRLLAHATSHDLFAEKARQWIEANPGSPNAFFYSGEPQGTVIV